MECVSTESIKKILDNIGNCGKVKDIIDKNEIVGDTIPYSFITEYLRALDDEARVDFYDKTKIFKDKLNKDYKSTNNKTCENINKILENALLESKRVSEYDKLEVQFNKSNEQIRISRDETRKNTELLNKYEEKMDKMQSEFISILSIFSAVIIAFFGGINLLGSALSNIDSTNRYRLIIVVTLIGFIMFNVIFMLLYSISRIINKSIEFGTYL